MSTFFNKKSFLATRVSVETKRHFDEVLSHLHALTKTALYRATVSSFKRS